MSTPFVQKSLLAILLIMLIGYLATALETVGPGEVVVVRRLGRTVEPPWTAGLHVGLPKGFEHRVKLRIDEVRRLPIGTARETENSAISGRGEYLTADRNLARVGAIIQFRVNEPVAYVLNAADHETVLGALAERALSRACSQFEIDDVLRNSRQQLSDALLATLARDCESLSLGIGLLSVNVVEARPPEEVVSEFSDAQAAVSDRERRATEAVTEAERIALNARARALKIEDLASTQAVQTRNNARSRAERFLAILGQNSGDTPSTRQRLYQEALQRGFQRLGKRVLLEPGQPIDLSILGGR